MAEEVVIVTDEDGSENKMELPLNEDGTLSLSTLHAAFHGSNGLKYRNPDTGAFRALKIDDAGMISAPAGGWGNTTFLCIFPPKSSENSKRKMMPSAEDYADYSPGHGGNNAGIDGTGSGAKQKRVDGNRKCSDLIVLGIPYKTTEEELKTYFDQFGTVLVSQVKRDFKTGKSKGFGFVRFEDYESQLKVLSQRHQVEGRWCDVKVPDSKKEKEEQQSQSRKVFVGRVPESMTAETLREYFTTKGEVTDVFIPKPFRSFAFVTFVNGDVAQSLCGEDHIIDGASVYVSQAVPKSEQEKAKEEMGSPPGLKAPRGGPPQHYPRPPPPNAYPPHHGAPQHYAPPPSHWSSGSEVGGWGSAAGYGGPPPNSWAYPPPPPPQQRAPAPGPVGAPPGGGRLGGGYHGDYPGSQSSMGASSALSSALSQQQAYLHQQSTMPTSNTVPQNGSNAAAANLATQGIGALNLGNLITPQAIQAAISNALAGLVGGGGAGSPAVSGADLATLLGNLQSAGVGNLGSMVGAAQSSAGAGSRTPAETWSWPATSVASTVAVPPSAGGKEDGGGIQGHPTWQPEDANTWGSHGV